jgi:hypothetical protein
VAQPSATGGLALTPNAWGGPDRRCDSTTSLHRTQSGGPQNYRPTGGRVAMIISPNDSFTPAADNRPMTLFGPTANPLCTWRSRRTVELSPLSADRVHIYRYRSQTCRLQSRHHSFQATISYPTHVTGLGRQWITRCSRIPHRLLICTPDRASGIRAFCIGTFGICDSAGYCRRKGPVFPSCP